MHAARSKTKNSFKICFTQYELPKEETFFFIHSFVHSFILFGGLGAFYCCSTNKSQIFSHLYLCIKLRMRVIGLFFLETKNLYKMYASHAIDNVFKLSAYDLPAV